MPNLWNRGVAASRTIHATAAAATRPVSPSRYTTGYWDCCKPSCSWNGKGNVDTPTRACDATGAVLDDINAASVCDGGTAASCADNQPLQHNAGVSLGFAAAAVGGITGLNGDENCLLSGADDPARRDDPARMIRRALIPQAASASSSNGPTRSTPGAAALTLL